MENQSLPGLSERDPENRPDAAEGKLAWSTPELRRYGALRDLTAKGIQIGDINSNAS